MSELRAGCHYLDLGGLYWMTGRQMELDAAFRRAGLIANLGMGSSPGKTNVMARHAVEGHGDNGRSVKTTAVTSPMEEWGPGGGVVSTAAPVKEAVGT